MYRVALYYRLGDWIMRQSATEDGRSTDGRYQFIVNPPDGSEVDFAVVIGKPHKKPINLRVAPENLVLAYYEPRSVVNYPASYRKQFSLVLSCQEETKGANIRHIPPVIPWTTGVNFLCRPFTVNKGYKDLLDLPTPKKEKLIAVITSDKSFTRGHYERLLFVKKLKEFFGNDLDIYGEGFHDFDDKLDILSPYKYQIVIENSRSPYYWTEKLKDSLIAETYPIYYGCTNLGDYFPEAEFPEIDIRRPEEAIRIIRATIDSDAYEKNREMLHALKQHCIKGLNIFDILARELDTLNPESTKQDVIIKPAKTIADFHNFINYTLMRNYWKRKGGKLKLEG